MRYAALILVCGAALCFGGCATYSQDLNRAEQHYQANEHERALALFRVLEPDLDSLDHSQQIEYCYFRGMNDYRLGPTYRADARHWLALARSLEQDRPGGMKVEWKDRLDDALKDLNQDVYGTRGGEPEGDAGDKGEAKTDDKSEDKTEKKGGDKPEAPKGKKCEVDNDCPSDLICEKGFCKKGRPL